ncbi:MAG: aminoacyl-tRNA hydrolase, partial [Candidatus Eisenbacteria bacterium]
PRVLPPSTFGPGPCARREKPARAPSREASLLAVVGLGNPGREYAGTRHNVGFRVVDALAGEDRPFEKKGRYLFRGSRIAGRKVVLVKPATFMNRSGAAVAALFRDFDLSLDRVLVVSDDANLPLGRLRVRPGGSDGGQKGLASIIREIGSEEFSRLRLGIGLPPEGTELADFVLEPFLGEEERVVGAMIESAVLCVRTWVTGGSAQAMERFNRRNPLLEGEAKEQGAE